MLATIVWAVLATTFAGYYYLQNGNNIEQRDNVQNSLNRLASNCSKVTSKYELLFTKYISLYGNYSSDISNTTFSNYTILMPALGSLIADFGKNYTDLLVQSDINRTYHQLSQEYEILLQGKNATENNFGDLLSEYYTLFNVSAFKELELAVNKTSILSVNIAFDYGNGTAKWFNGTRVPAGYTLFDLTQAISTIKYSSWGTGPGQIFIDSINGKSSTRNSYWLWYYWDSSGKSWTWGPVGCDAWLLQNGGIYEWKYQS